MGGFSRRASPRGCALLIWLNLPLRLFIQASGSQWELAVPQALSNTPPARPLPAPTSVLHPAMFSGSENKLFCRGWWNGCILRRGLFWGSVTPKDIFLRNISYKLHFLPSGPIILIINRSPIPPQSFNVNKNSCILTFYASQHDAVSQYALIGYLCVLCCCKLID